MNMGENERALLTENETMRDALQALNGQLDESEAELERLREENERMREVIYTYHEWLERHEQKNRPEHPAEPRRGYIGLDHRVGENAAGCSGCAALEEA